MSGDALSRRPTSSEAHAKRLKSSASADARTPSRDPNCTNRLALDSRETPTPPVPPSTVPRDYTENSGAVWGQ